MRVTWWQLAPFGLLGKAHYPRLGEHLLPFSSYTQPEAKKQFYYQPPLDEAWSAKLTLSGNRRISWAPKIAVYPGKGRLRRLPDSLLSLTRSSEILLITRDRPRTREALFEQLLLCDGLISFDELSQLNLEAASLRIPVFLANRLFPDSCLDNFAIKRLREWLTSDPHVFTSLIQVRGCDSRDAWSVDDLMSENSGTVSAFHKLAKHSLPETIVCSQQQIKQLKAYGDELRRTRAICANQKVGHSGGALLLLGDYAQYLQSSSRKGGIFLKIRTLDAMLEFLAWLPILPESFWGRAKHLYHHFTRQKPPT